jgi:hypothetical protein
MKMQKKKRRSPKEHLILTEQQLTNADTEKKLIDLKSQNIA